MINIQTSQIDVETCSNVIVANVIIRYVIVANDNNKRINTIKQTIEKWSNIKKTL